MLQKLLTVLVNLLTFLSTLSLECLIALTSKLIGAQSSKWLKLSTRHSLSLSILVKTSLSMEKISSKKSKMLLIFTKKKIGSNSE
jgi:hypothetical protein